MIRTAPGRTVHPRASRPGQRSRLAAAVLIAVFVVPLSVSGTAVALADIAAALGSDPVGQQWALNGFNITFAASTLAWGSLADRIGRWRSFILGGAIFIGASIVSFCAPDYLLLDAARILAGIGAGAVFSVGSALLSLASGPTLSGIVTQAVGWNHIFAIQGVLLILSVVIMLTCRNVTRSEPRAPGAFDWPAAVLFFGVIAALVSAFVAGSSGTWITPGTLIPVAIGVLCVLGLTLRERRVRVPLLDFRLIGRPRFLGVTLVVVVASFSFASCVTYVPSLVQAAWGLSPTESGLFVMFMTLPTLGVPLVAGFLVARGAAPRTVLAVAVVLMVLGSAAIAGLAGSPPGVLAAVMVVLGIGFGLHAGLVDNEALAVAPENNAGMAAGWINTIRVGSEAVAVSLFGAVFIPALARADSVTAFRSVGIAGAVIALVFGLVSIITMYWRRGHVRIGTTDRSEK
ncbi:MFS family permease [Mycetocola sp. BIGb0189]|uniref:MFS transporter n=1 Tax=Mycetocola sp. BIGb0189 TaxID=2940604 RepID=UPI002168ED79|nr:MFS transporter [Mycetocola sp. BIGb0189]MCS4275612.1 MFS family permease [Mycetocola sp. BIGb0189]